MLKITIHLTHEQIALLMNNKTICIELTAHGAHIFPADDNIGQVPNHTEHPKEPDTAATEAPAKTDFLAFFAAQMEQQANSRSERTLETYRMAYNRFLGFLGGKTRLDFSEMTGELMKAYQAQLLKENLSLNTVSFYMRKLQAVYNKAVDEGLTDDRHPFRHVYTGKAKTEKRAIPAEGLKAIKQVELKDPYMRFSRDLILLSYYLRGMSFVDMAYLKRSDIKDGILTYRRHKTGQTLSIRWEQEMQNIVDRHPSPTDIYLLPLIHRLNGKERNQYRHQQTKVNKALHEIGRLAGLPQPLTMYCARHSWASIAKEQGVPVEVISRGMGHTSEKTTQIYLKDIEEQAVDKVNRQLISLIEDCPTFDKQTPYTGQEKR